MDSAPSSSFNKPATIAGEATWSEVTRRRTRHRTQNRDRADERRFEQEIRHDCTGQQAGSSLYGISKDTTRSLTTLCGAGSVKPKAIHVSGIDPDCPLEEVVRCCKSNPFVVTGCFPCAPGCGERSQQIYLLPKNYWGKSMSHLSGQI